MYTAEIFYTKYLIKAVMVTILGVVVTVAVVVVIKTLSVNKELQACNVHSQIATILHNT